MAHDPAGRQAVEHGHPAEDRLRGHAERHQRGEDGQVAAERAAQKRGQEGEHRAERDHAGQQPIAVLDGAVGVELGLDDRAVALGPRRAAQPRAGQPHAGAGEDDQH